MDTKSQPTDSSDPTPIEFTRNDLMVRLDVRLSGDPAAITPVVESA